MFEGDTLAERLALDKISRLKRKARKIWSKIEKHYSQYDCSMNMADFINPDGYTLKYKLAQVWVELTAIDKKTPEAPDFIKGIIARIKKKEV